jgi:hypothetical protein
VPRAASCSPAGGDQRVIALSRAVIGRVASVRVWRPQREPLRSPERPAGIEVAAPVPAGPGQPELDPNGCTTRGSRSDARRSPRAGSEVPFLPNPGVVNFTSRGFQLFEAGISEWPRLHSSSSRNPGEGLDRVSLAPILTCQGRVIMRGRFIAAGLVGLGLAACGETGGSSSAGMISVDVKSIPQTAVGQNEEVQFVVKNVGSQPIGNLMVKGLMGDFKKHNVVLTYTCDPTGCQEDTSDPGFGDVLNIGQVTAGTAVTIDVKAVAKEAGNFTYKVEFLDTKASDVNLTESDGKAYTYNVDETVTP